MTKYYPFRPALEGIFRERFHRRVYLLCSQELPFKDIERVVREEFAWATEGERVNPRQRRIYRAVWLLLRDLLFARWSCRWNQGVVEVAPPTPFDGKYTQQELKDIKSQLRDAIAEAKRLKLTDSQDFIHRMEDPPSAGAAHHPITSLIADAKELYRDLLRISKASSRELQVQELRKVVQPYLQLVREAERCEHTGHRLSDIWRYFRLTWTTPAESTPGRTLLYLVRDRARPFHPVIGIASLENGPIRITVRDHELGWTVEAFRQELESSSSGRRSLFTRLIRHIGESIAELKIDDLCSMSEIQNPTSKLLDRLSAVAQQSQVERGAALRAWLEREENEEDDLEGSERSELGNISMAAEEALFRRKRAEQLLRLLIAREEISSLLVSEDFESAAKRFVTSEKGASAIWAALVAQKSKHVGTSILELNVCGAIPPYNYLLGGKLVALLVLSPEIVADYKERYGNRPSDIASRLKGEPVVRPASLVFLGTSSLYSVGSSQYNRLRLPEGLLSAGAPEVRWKHLGETSGHGTWHISRLTLQCLEEAAYGEYRDINHVFGEGASPKLRLLRKALLTLFEPGQRSSSDEFARHAMPRLVYGAWLAPNGRAFLKGEVEAPEYYYEPDSQPKSATEKIAAYWSSRWLLMRLQNPEVLKQLKHFDASSVLVSRDLDQAEPFAFLPINDEQERVMVSHEGRSDDYIEFVQGLYRGVSAYADWADLGLLSTVHIPTKLDEAVLAALNQGKSVVLTGNPGDGKTHLLRFIEQRVAELSPLPILELDASRVIDQDLYERWRSASEQGRPFCVAINEAVLFSLAQSYPDFQPLQNAWQQVKLAVSYEDREPDADSDVIVFDLSRRDVLNRAVVDAVIEKLARTDLAGEVRCSQCPATGCDFTRNQRLLRNKLFRVRLQEVLDRISLRGYHATIRELSAFVSFLLFGGRSCDDLVRTSGEDKYAMPNLVYTGNGRLFDALSDTFDPARVSHPIWDDNLIGAHDAKQDGWALEWTREFGAIDPSNVSQFIARKRAFYFLHNKGDIVLELSPADSGEFRKLLEADDQEAVRVLVRALNRFFGISNDSRELYVWQSHRYDYSPRKILYSCSKVKRPSLMVARPRLLSTMKSAFELAADHLILSLRSSTVRARLKVDFEVYHILAQAERGVPVMMLDNDATRRIWQFMEQLTLPLTLDETRDVHVVILDPVTSDRVEVNLDAVAGKYHEISYNSRS